MTKIRNNAKQILTENYAMNNKEGLSFYDWAKSEAENDPYFYGWLFSDDGLDDFGFGMNEEQTTLANDFFEGLK